MSKVLRAFRYLGGYFEASSIIKAKVSKNNKNIAKNKQKLQNWVLTLPFCGGILSMVYISLMFMVQTFLPTT